MVFWLLPVGKEPLFLVEGGLVTGQRLNRLRKKCYCDLQRLKALLIFQQLRHR
jgi:hypothetical protein